MRNPRVRGPRAQELVLLHEVHNGDDVRCLRCIGERVSGSERNRTAYFVILNGNDLVGLEDTLEEGDKGRHVFGVLSSDAATVFNFFALCAF